MELYNFFTEIVNENQTYKVRKLHLIFTEIQELDPVFVELITRLNYKDEIEYSIVGQILYEETKLFYLFGKINYTCFDAYSPKINNLNNG